MSRKRHSAEDVGPVATMEVKRGDNVPLKERFVPRETSDTCSSGEETYELLSTNVAVYVMQSMSLSEYTKLTMEHLALLDLSLASEMLDLPDPSLMEESVLGPCDGNVVVLQDRLKNT